jgi:Spy/CpxP family protein refolding chaperone
MNKKLIVALGFFVASFAVSIDTATAQNGRRDAQQNQTPEQRTDNQLQRMTKALSLSADQATQVKPILMELNQKRDAMRDASDKRAAMKEMRDFVMGQDEKMKKVLSAEQYTKYEDMKENARDNMKGKRGRRN